MMAMTQQPFAHPGAMPGHAVHGGHPMGPGHPSIQGIPGVGQPGVSMGQPMHSGMATGPGASQVSQAGLMMPGIPQGMGAPAASVVNHNAIAMSHLNPGHTVFAQQQQQMQQASKSSPSSEIHCFLFDTSIIRPSLRVHSSGSWYYNNYIG
jgi:hypothetical protein